MEYSFNWNAISSGAPYVTISELSIAFNSAAVSSLNSPDKVLIGYDAARKVIGIKPYADERSAKPFEFAGKVLKGWVRVGCKDFIRYLSATTGVSFTPAVKYVAEYDDKYNILLVKIDNGEAVQENLI